MGVEEPAMRRRSGDGTRPRREERGETEDVVEDVRTTLLLLGCLELGLPCWTEGAGPVVGGGLVSVLTLTGHRQELAITDCCVPIGACVPVMGSACRVFDGCRACESSIMAEHCPVGRLSCIRTGI